MKEKRFEHYSPDCGNRERIMGMLYQCYMGRADDSNEAVKECFSLLKEYTGELPFEQSDQICSAVCSACVECERLAFLDGVIVGARLILELTAG